MMWRALKKFHLILLVWRRNYHPVTWRAIKSSIVSRSSLAGLTEAARVLHVDLVAVLRSLDRVAVPTTTDHTTTESAYGKRAFSYTESRR